MVYCLTWKQNDFALKLMTVPQSRSSKEFAIFNEKDELHCLTSNNTNLQQLVLCSVSTTIREQIVFKQLVHARTKLKLIIVLWTHTSVQCILDAHTQKKKKKKSKKNFYLPRS